MQSHPIRHAHCWFGFVTSLFVVIAGLWLWQANDRLVVEYRLVGKPGVVMFRYAAVSLIAMGEGIFAWLVIGNLWKHDWFTSLLGYLAIFVSTVALIGAMALRLSGQ